MKLGLAVMQAESPHQAEVAEQLLDRDSEE
jgi:hypothetical protein